MFFCLHVTLLTRGCSALTRYDIVGKGLTGVGLFLKAPTVMRPCDGTSGLVRGNRRKAVFAFKGLFFKGVSYRAFALGCLVLSRYPEVRGKSKTSEHNPIFANKTAGRGRVKPGSGRPISVLPRTSESARRKYAAKSETLEHAAFFSKEAAGRSVAAIRRGRYAWNLPHTSGLRAHSTLSMPPHPLKMFIKQF